MSLSTVANAAGISTATLSRIETGKQSLDVGLLVEIAEILRVSASQLLGIEGEMQSTEEALVASLAALPNDKRTQILVAATKQSLGRQARQPLQSQLDVLLATMDMLREELADLQRRAVQRR